MVLIVADTIGPLRHDYDAKRVCEVLVDALRRAFANSSMTELKVDIHRYVDNFECNPTLYYNRPAYGRVAGRLSLSITNQPLGVYVRVRRYDFLNSLTDQMIHVVKATAERELAITSLFNRNASPANRSIPFTPIPGLTERETEVAHLLARGRTHKQIAEKLVISWHAVKTHAANIRAKIDSRERPQLASGHAWLADFLRQRGYGEV
jgi:DNA-binding CsgD family transcriptional regulator